MQAFKTELKEMRESAMAIHEKQNKRRDERVEGQHSNNRLGQIITVVATF